MDLLEIAWQLVQAFIKTFANAVAEYPLPTAVIALISFLLWPTVRAQFPSTDPRVVGGLQFTITVIVASVVGWIFNATLKVMQFLFSALAIPSSLLKDHPIEFAEHLLVWLAIGALFVLYKSGWRVKHPSKPWAALVILPVFWASYITANLHVAIAAPQAPVMGLATKPGS